VRAQRVPGSGQSLTSVASPVDVQAPSEPDVLVQGPSLALRYPRPMDALALYALASDPEVTRFLSWGPYRHVGEAEAWLATLGDRRRTGVTLELAVVASDDETIGITLLYELNRRDRRAVVGTWLGRAHWGTGANREAKALLAHLAFGPLDLDRLGAYADVRNARSRRARFTDTGRFHGMSPFTRCSVRTGGKASSLACRCRSPAPTPCPRHSRPDLAGPGAAVTVCSRTVARARPPFAKASIARRPEAGGHAHIH
jgi:RimJ/RimL family protein N-acetyltransferase